MTGSVFEKEQGRSETVTHAEFREVALLVEKNCQQIAATGAQLTEITRKLDELHNVWTQAKGGAKLAQFVFWIAGPLVGAIWWVKHHIKW